MSKNIIYGILGLVVLVFGGAVIFSSATPTKIEKKEVAVVATSTSEVPTKTNTPVPVKTQPVPVKPVTSEYTYYSVTQVVDGDTIKISMNGQEETLRLIGLDTPETVDPRKPVQCFGKEASNKGKELLTGRKVRIEVDPSQGARDKYNRLLAYIYRDDGLFYNQYMIEQGYAHEYTYNTPYKYQAQLKAAQKTAQTNQAGLWSPNTCNGDTTSANPATTQPVVTTPPPTSGGDKDCSDFSTQAEAQSYFDGKGGSSTNNVDKLDGSDHDGRVCESLK